MRIKHVMTKDPHCCLPSDSAEKAAGIMRDEHAGVVPVVASAENRRIVGVVTDRDLCMNVVAEGRDPHTTTVEECMTTRVVSCSPNDAVEKGHGADTREPDPPRAGSQRGLRAAGHRLPQRRGGARDHQVDADARDAEVRLRADRRREPAARGIPQGRVGGTRRRILGVDMALYRGKPTDRCSR